MTRLVLLGLLVVGLGYTAASAVTQIQPGEKAVVRRFGRIVDTPGPGLYLGLPWGMDRVDRVAVGRVRQVTLGNLSRSGSEDPADARAPEGQLLSGDHNLVNVQVKITYKIKENEVDKFVLQADRAEDLIARAGEAALAEWVAARNVDHVLLRGKGETPSWLVQQVTERVQQYDLGVHVTHSVVDFYTPDEVKSAFDEVARADAETKTRINQAEQEADRKQREAASQIYNIRLLAGAYAREQVLMAQAEAENFDKRLDQYRKLGKENPNYLAGIWWDEMGRLFTRMRQNGRLDLLDNHLGPDGLDITQMPLLQKKR